MAPGRQELRAWRKENDAGNRCVSITSSEDVPVPGANVPFEELLARELRNSEGSGAKPTAASNGKASKKPFLKRGARGWWMRQPGAKQKVVKHTLASKGDEEESPVRSRPVVKRSEKQQQRRRSSSASSSGTLSPVTTPPEQVRTAPVPVPPQTLSPAVSPIRRTRHSNQDGFDDGGQKNEEFAAWKNASFRSTTSTDIMGMKNVRQSYEARQEREANEMAEFEAIERDLAAEKEAYLMEKQQQQQQQQYQHPAQAVRPEQDHDNQTDHWGLPYSSFVSDLHEQEQSRWQTTRSGSIFDDSLDEDADSALVLDGQANLSKDDWLSERDGFTDQLRDHFGYGNNYGEPPSDLSAVSFDDSVPWDDGLSFQPRQSVAHEQHSNVEASNNLMNSESQRYYSFDGAPSIPTEQQTVTRQVYFRGDDSTDDLGYNNPDPVADSDAPVSSLVQNMFGEYVRNQGEESVRDDMDSIAAGVDSSSNDVDTPSACSPPPPPAQDKSLSTLKQKLRSKQKPPTKTPTNKAKINNARAGLTKGGPSRAPAKQKPGASTGKQTKPRGREAQPVDSGVFLPAVIEEKLYELEEEVKFYKSETLQLQKRKDYYEQEVKKLALERDEFARYQQEQRVLIEKEWERERAKMKKEEKLQERQWKLRMNATISHQDRKDRGEVETLKAQIVKMQLDEKALARKWKAVNDNLRQRVTELEGKNSELGDEIKFLEKDRLEQWEKYERLLKEKQDASNSGLKTRSTADTFPSDLGETSKLRTMDDVFAIKGTADELLQRWSLPHTEIKRGDQDHAFTASSGYHRHLETTAVEDYNPKRYSLDREDTHSSSEPGAFTNGGDIDNANAKDSFTRTTGAAKTYEWALPEAEDDGALHDLGYTNQKSADGDGAISASTSSLSEHRTVSQEIEHAGGKKEVVYSDGSRKIMFPDGNEKDIDASGHVVIKFTNGDHKELFPDTGISVYYYYEAQTKLTTYPDNRKVYEFPNQQVETSLPDGTTEIQFADGIKKTIRPNGDEFSVFPDGTTMLEQPDGLREVTLLNQKKIRYFPDGQMACVTPGGKETRVGSDSELKQLMDST
ncbi:hypothetical protein PF008_g9760 [Phytophthora fragariae]|uniref:Centromere protein J C-terminal domain-containing protein n=1 Tax=Phytophthora fragariae TaxID=53985 RepID=A0A6G0RVK2_9STRA|nr:hypothetical protein PF008_g9760 [Phytophthora fragariae]